MRGKGLVRDLVLIAFGASIATVVSVQADTTTKQGSRDETPDLYAITCNSGSISNATISEGSMGAYDLFWRSVGAGTAYDGAAYLTDCVISTQ